MKKLLLIVPLLGIVGCASMPKNVDVYMRNDVDISKSKIISFPLMLTDGKTLKPENSAFSVPVVDAYAFKEWSSYLGSENTIAIPKVALDKIPGSYDALNHIINALDSTSAIEQSTELTKLLEGITSQFGDGAFAFALVFENKQEYNSTKQLHLNMGIFDIKKLTWKWITKAVHQKSLVPVPYEVAVQKLIKDSMTVIGGGKGKGGSAKTETAKPKGFSSGNSVLEVDFGMHGDPSGPNYSSLAKYNSCYYGGVNYIYNFATYFGMGAGYSKLSMDYSYDGYWQDSSYKYEAHERGTNNFTVYKLLSRFTFFPSKRWNPELTLGVGGYSLKEDFESNWGGSYYDTSSSSWVPYAPQNWKWNMKRSGYTGSVGINLRYFLTKHLSVGAKGEYDYFMQTPTGYKWSWYEFGAFTGLKF